MPIDANPETVVRLLTIMPEFDAAEFLRRLDAGEFDANLCDVLDHLSEMEAEQLALLLNGRLRVRVASASS
jgi:hypothetical protein